MKRIALLTFILSGLLLFTGCEELNDIFTQPPAYTGVAQTEREAPPSVNEVPSLPYSNQGASREIGTAVVSFIDVGQGDSILIQTENHVMLIDAAHQRYSYRIISYLQSYDISFIDVVVAAHPHADHIGGFPAVFNAFEVGVIYKPDVEHTTLTFGRFIDSIAYHEIDIIMALAGDYFILDDVHFSVVAPTGYGYSNLNNHSVVIRMAHGDTSFLFTGDTEAKAELRMLAYGRYISSTVLQVPHHGSRSSTTQEFLDAVSPVYVVISVGYGNQYGHPHDVVIGRLENFGATILRTDIHGTVKFVSDGIGLEVQTAVAQ